MWPLSVFCCVFLPCLASETWLYTVIQPVQSLIHRTHSDQTPTVCCIIQPWLAVHFSMLFSVLFSTIIFLGCRAPALRRRPRTFSSQFASGAANSTKTQNISKFSLQISIAKIGLVLRQMNHCGCTPAVTGWPLLRPAPKRSMSVTRVTVFQGGPQFFQRFACIPRGSDDASSIWFEEFVKQILVLIS